jgi:hypothetical protein
MPKTAMASGNTHYHAPHGESSRPGFTGAKQGINFVHPQQPNNSRNQAIEHAMSAQQLPSSSGAHGNYMVKPQTGIRGTSPVFY